MRPPRSMPVAEDACSGLFVIVMDPPIRRGPWEDGQTCGCWRDSETAPEALRAGLPFFAPGQVKSYFKPARYEGKGTGKSYFNPFETPTKF